MRRITIAIALVACAALAVASPAAARPGHGHGPGGPGGPRCETDHETPTAETVAEHVANAYAAVDAFNAAVAVPDDEAAAAALRTYATESRYAICESKKVDGPPPEIDSLETLGDMHVYALTAYGAAFDAAGDALKRPLRRAIVREKRSCGKVIHVLTRMGSSEDTTPEDKARIDALVAEYTSACRAVDVPGGPDRPDRPDRPGPGGVEGGGEGE